MIIRLSLKLAKRLKCPFSQPSADIPHQRSLDSWSGDLLRMRNAGSHAIMMNDATLSTVIVPLAGVSDFTRFVPGFLTRVEDLWLNAGGSFDPLNQSIFVLKRSGRELIGSLTDIVRLLRYHVEDDLAESGFVDWKKAADFINATPFSVINYAVPEDELARQVGEF